MLSFSQTISMAGTGIYGRWRSICEPRRETGLAYAMADNSYYRYQNAGIVAYCAKLLFVQAATFTRISLILFYYRLVRDSGIQWFTYVLHGSMFFVVGLGISFTCVGIWLCSYAPFLHSSGHQADRISDLSRLTGLSLRSRIARV